jgi:bile acid:Na+ symporter, BASS family
MEPKQLKYLSSACFVIGFLIPFWISNFIGMSFSAMPLVTVATIGLWIIGLLLRYHAYLGTAKPPATLAFRMRLGNFISSEPSLFLTLGIVFGYLYYPSVEKSVVPTVGPYLLMIIMFTMGLAINLQEWLRMLQKPKVVGIAVLLRWLCMPLVAFLLSLVFIQLIPGATGQALAIGMIVLGTTPTGGGSNALTLISKGDLALSVSATAINTILAPFIQPLLILWLAGGIANLDANAIFLDLVRMVVAPVVAGTILGSIIPKAVARIKPLFGPLAIICLSFIVMGTMSKGTSTLIQQVSILLYLVVICLVQAVAGLSLGYFLPKFFGFNYAQRKAACFEVGVENAAMAMLIGLRHFNPLTALPSIVYGKIQYIITSTIVVSRFQAIEDKEVLELAPTPVAAAGVATVQATVPNKSEGERP